MDLGFITISIDMYQKLIYNYSDVEQGLLVINFCIHCYVYIKLHLHIHIHIHIYGLHVFFSPELLFLHLKTWYVQIRTF